MPNRARALLSEGTFDQVTARLTHLGLLAGISREDAAKVWRNPADYPGGELPEPQAPDYVVTLTYGVDGPTRRVEIDITREALTTLQIGNAYSKVMRSRPIRTDSSNP